MTARLSATTKPAQSEILSMIDGNPKLADSTKRQYKKALTNAIAAGVNLTDAASLAAYATDLSKSSRAFLKAAIRLWSKRVVTQAKSQATPENIAAVQATEARFEALNDTIKVEASKGQKAHTWLTQAEVKRLLDTCNPKTTIGKRNRVVLGLLVAAGLRREELANLTFDDVVFQPVAGKMRTVLNIHGKGAKGRVVPISDKLAAALDQWQAIAGPGFVARNISKGGAIGDSISTVGIFHIARNAGDAIGKADLAPHDLRRTYAQLGYEAGISITQISKLLGHSSVATTQRYLNLDLNLETTISDFIPF